MNICISGICINLLKIIAFCKDKKYYTQNEGIPLSCDGPPPRLADLNPAKAIEMGIILFIDGGHVMKNFFKNIPNNCPIWADVPNKLDYFQNLPQDFCFSFIS